MSSTLQAEKSFLIPFTWTGVFSVAMLFKTEIKRLRPEGRRLTCASQPSACWFVAWRLRPWGSSLAPFPAAPQLWLEFLDAAIRQEKETEACRSHRRKTTFICRWHDSADTTRFKNGQVLDISPKKTDKWPDEHKRTCSASRRKCQSEPQSCYFAATGTAVTKKPETAVRWGREGMRTLTRRWGKRRPAQPLRTMRRQFLEKTKHKITVRPSDFASGTIPIYPKELKAGS